jgi:UDP-N-acetyl-2-amino-2-deoxyglucuronate dehydrogenase
MIRAAVVGWGDVAVVHDEAITAIEGAELVGVVDVDADRRRDAVERRGVPAFQAVDDLVDAVGPDVVHVTTPHDQHVAPAVAALGHGVHVLLEKPLAADLEEGRRLVDAVAASTARVGVCFQNRYNVSCQKLRELLDSGQLGKIRGAFASVVWTRTPGYYQDKPWRGLWQQAGGGVLINQAIHTLDLVQWLLGDVVDLTGHVTTNKYRDVIEVEDTATLLLTHVGGVETTFYATLTAPWHRPVELELQCDHAFAVIRDGLTVRWADGRAQQWEERTVPSGGRAYWGVSHELLIRDFYARLDDPEPFWISPAEALKSLEILKRAYAVSGV